MIYTQGGVRWRIVVGLFCGVYRARWIEDTTRTGLPQDTAAGVWRIEGPNLSLPPLES